MLRTAPNPLTDSRRNLIARTAFAAEDVATRSGSDDVAETVGRLLGITANLNYSYAEAADAYQSVFCIAAELGIMDVRDHRLFRLEGVPGTYKAIALGPDWNGWATPVVHVDEAVALLTAMQDAGAGVTWDHRPADAALIVTHDDGLVIPLTIEAGDHTVDLGELGYTFTLA